MGLFVCVSTSRSSNAGDAAEALLPCYDLSGRHLDCTHVDTLTHTRIVWRVVTHNPFILFPLVFCYFKSLVCAAMHSGRQQASRPAAGTRCSSPVLIGFAHAEIESGSATSGPTQPVGMEREMLPAFDNRLPASATSPCGLGI